MDTFVNKWAKMYNAKIPKKQEFIHKNPKNPVNLMKFSDMMNFRAYDPPVP